MTSMYTTPSEYGFNLLLAAEKDLEVDYRRLAAEGKTFAMEKNRIVISAVWSEIARLRPLVEASSFVGGSTFTNKP